MINLLAVCRSYRAISFADGILCAVVLALGMSVTAAGCAITDQLNQAAIKRSFDFAVDERVSRIQRRFVIQTLQLDSLRRFFINADDVTDKEFRGFVTPLINEGESYGWLQRVSQQGLDDLRAKALSDGVSDFSLHERDPATRGRVPIQSRPEHFILLYLVAHDYTDATVSPGMDIVSRPGRLALLQQARRTQKMAVSEPLVMMNGQTGIFFVAPVFDDELKKAGDDGLRGFALATMQVSFLMEQNIPASSLEYLNVVLTVNDADQHEKEVYRSREPAVDSQLYAQHKLTFADRSYTLKLSATRDFLRLNDNHLNLYGVAAAGGSLTLLLTLVIYLLISQRARAVSLVEERTGELVRLSTTDYLTEVYNRRYFEQSMARLLIESRDGALALCVVMFDIDQFKRINDCFGHLQGDRVLRQLSQMIRSTTRSSDILCRTGGEEFTLICPNTTLGAAGQMAEKLRQTIGAGSFADVGHVTCSFGVAEWQTWESLDHLLKRVDDAVYEAKADGRDRVVVHSCVA